MLHICFICHTVLSCLGVVLFPDDPAIRLRFLHVDGIATLAHSMEHLLVALVHVDAAVQILVHPRLHLGVSQSHVLPGTLRGHGRRRVSLEVVVQSRGWIYALWNL